MEKGGSAFLLLSIRTGVSTTFFSHSVRWTFSNTADWAGTLKKQPSRITFFKSASMIRKSLIGLLAPLASRDILQDASTEVTAGMDRTTSNNLLPEAILHCLQQLTHEALTFSHASDLIRHTCLPYFYVT